MVKKDYELVAKILNKNIHDETPLALKHNVPTVAIAMAQQFADVFAQANPKFKKYIFLMDCGIKRDSVNHRYIKR